jgi:hypothetical protein
VLLIMSLMLLLSLASIAMLSALRAYVNGESLWSKAERQAVADLQKYGASNDESYFRDFESECRFPSETAPRAWSCRARIPTFPRRAAACSPAAIIRTTSTA